MLVVQLFLAFAPTSRGCTPAGKFFAAAFALKSCSARSSSGSGVPIFVIIEAAFVLDVTLSNVELENNGVAEVTVVVVSVSVVVVFVVVVVVLVSSGFPPVLAGSALAASELPRDFLIMGGVKPGG